MESFIRFLERRSKYLASLAENYPRNHPKFHDEVEVVSVRIKKYAKYIAAMTVCILTDNGIGITRFSLINITLILADELMMKAIFVDKSIQAIKNVDTIKGTERITDDEYDAQTIEVAKTTIKVIKELLGLN